MIKFGSVALTMFAVACGSETKIEETSSAQEDQPDVSQPIENSQSKTVSFGARTLEELPTCTEELNHSLGYTDSDKQFFICSANKWDKVDPLSALKGTSEPVEEVKPTPLFDTEEADKDTCPHGCKVFMVGNDLNGNQFLDDNEITSRQKFCNQPTYKSVIATEDYEGEVCDSGGHVIKVGHDYNEDTYLDDYELENDVIVCNQTVKLVQSWKYDDFSTWDHENLDLGDSANYQVYVYSIRLDKFSNGIMEVFVAGTIIYKDSDSDVGTNDFSYSYNVDSKLNPTHRAIFKSGKTGGDNFHFDLNTENAEEPTFTVNFRRIGLFTGAIEYDLEKVSSR